MIPNKEKKMALSCCKKKLSSLLHGATSEHNDDFYCLDFLYFFRTESNLKSYEKICKNTDFHGIVMLSEKNNKLEFNQSMNSDKMKYIIYVDTEF